MVKPDYTGTAKEPELVSAAGRFLFIEVLKFFIFWTVNVFR
jgi:hypothetical protein